MQKRINEDISLLDDHLEDMFSKGWKEGTDEDLKEGYQIRYIRKQDSGVSKFITGGIVVSICDDYLIFKGGPRLWSLQFSDILRLWYFDDLIKSKKPKKKNTIELKLKLEGNFIVEHNGVIIFRAKNNRDKQNFMNTQKYTNIMNGSPYTIV